MYVRFIVPQKDRDSGCRLGIFQAMYVLRDMGDLCAYEEEYASEVLCWFSQHLRKPSSFTRVHKRYPSPKAICWFRDSAHEHIAHMWDMVAILEEHDRVVAFIRTQRPGYITYQDRFQVAAVPFSDTETSDRAPL